MASAWSLHVPFPRESVGQAGAVQSLMHASSPESRRCAPIDHLPRLWPLWCCIVFSDNRSKSLDAHVAAGADKASGTCMYVGPDMRIRTSRTMRTGASPFSVATLDYFWLHGRSRASDGAGWGARSLLVHTCTMTYGVCLIDSNINLSLNWHQLSMSWGHRYQSRLARSPVHLATKSLHSPATQSETDLRAAHYFKPTPARTASQ